MIYFDNAATTMPMHSSLVFHNPSSPHVLGIKSERALRDARNQIASALGSGTGQNQGDIIFTSGGTESNNLAILGFALAFAKQGVSLISTPYEHPSILAPIQHASDRGWAGGMSDLKQIPQGNVLVSLSHVNHETGDINDVNKIGADIKQINPTAVIHIDGVQGLCKEAVCLDNIDMYSFSGHKCHGPMGVGGLWVRKGVRLTPLLHGGGQESGLRPGTENVSGIVQMAEAVSGQTKAMAVNYAHVTAIKNVLLSLQEELPDVCVNAMGANTSPYILNMSFMGVKGEILVHALSEKGICVSMGAACRSRKKGQPALEIMGFAPKIAESAIRFSFSALNTLEEAMLAREIIIGEVNRFRKLIAF